jgi:hypothetical protein
VNNKFFNKKLVEDPTVPYVERDLIKLGQIPPDTNVVEKISPKFDKDAPSIKSHSRKNKS